MTHSKMCSDAGLIDEALLRKSVKFFGTVAGWLLTLVDPNGYVCHGRN